MQAIEHIGDERNATTSGNGTLLLSAAEISELTGTIQPARQVRWLEERGWPYSQAYGRSQYPRVARSVFDARMLGKDPTRVPNGPKLDALDRLWRLS